MDIVLGVSMAPTTVRLVLVEGENADGVTVDDEGFEVAAAESPATSSTADQVVAAILGTRESAVEGDYRLASTGVTWTDPVEATALRDALAAHKVENVMLVSAFLAAAALAQSVGNAVGYARTGLLFLEPDTVTFAIVDSADGSILDVRRQPMQSADTPAEMVAELAGLDSPPDGVFVVGSGVDIATIKPQLETATTLPVSGPEEPELALARGAALASANAPLFTSSTAALAYAQDPDPDWTMAELVDPFALGPGSTGVRAVAGIVDGALAYSAAESDLRADQDDHARKPFLVALSVMMVFFVGVMALVISLAVSVRPVVSQRPGSAGNLIVPAKQVPAPPPNAEVQAPVAPPPQSVPQPAPQVQVAEAPAPEALPSEAPAPEAPAPVPVHAAPPRVMVPAAAPAPEVPAPTPEPPAAVPPAPAPAPAAPAPAPMALAPAPAPMAPAPLPMAPAPVPVPVLVPIAPPIIPIGPRPIFSPPAPRSPFQPGGGSGWPQGGGTLGGGGAVPGGGLGGNPGGFGGSPGGFGGGHGGFGGGGFGGHGGGR